MEVPIISVKVNNHGYTTPLHTFDITQPLYLIGKGKGSKESHEKVYKQGEDEVFVQFSYFNQGDYHDLQPSKNSQTVHALSSQRLPIENYEQVSLAKVDEANDEDAGLDMLYRTRIGRTGYARVLVEVHAKKGLVDSIDMCVKLGTQEGKVPGKGNVNEGFINVNKKKINDAGKTNNVQQNNRRANKFAILQEVEEEGLSLKFNKKEKEEDGRYVMMKLKPSFSTTNHETDIKLDENDVYVDKSGTASFINEKEDMIEFQECVNEIEIEDINCFGMHFTWTKSFLNPNATVLKKIDRIMGNNSFFAKFSIANAIFLPYGIFNHSPAILKIPQAMIKKRKSFRLANYVTGKREFNELVKDKWNTKVQGHAMYKLVSKLKGLKQHLNKLKWKNGNLFKKVADIKTKLYNVQRKIDLDPTNKSLKNENVGLLKEYKEASIYEEKLLRQKAKITWLREGDKNSAYFHKVLKGWTNRNIIMFVCAEDGIRYKNCKVATQFVKHFEGFLGINPPVTKLTVDDNYLFNRKISKTKAIKMIREVSDDEIKIALFDIDDDKAPGPDGYISKFYKKAWNFVKDILRQFGFPDLMIGWIMTCISTLKFTICVNGERFGYFKGGRGLRQGEPISPYIFTMVMEMLNLMVKDEIRKEKAFKFHFGCKKLRITHLCFTDDLIMFSHGDRVFVLTLKRALDKFSAILGLHPNLGKCTMFYGSLDDDTKNEICSIFPFKEGKLLIGDHMRYKIRNDKMENVWHDKWYKDISLSISISKKEVFYACFHDYNKVSDLIDDNGWRWPHGWIVKYPWLNMIQVPVLSNSSDKLVWVDNKGNGKRFSTYIVWKDVRGINEKVCWYKLVWHTNCIPKHNFILWLTAKKKLCIQDRLIKWYPNRVFECSLCQKGHDSHDRLFFNRDYAQKF
nr:RNA-directed DNA polymerase, eukaryota, reverse transcriptase zinc-binding domain protein [Tanacetum cinerariifolium]